MWLKGLSILLFGATLAACIPTQQQLTMERDLEVMKRRLADIERSTATLRQDRTGDVKERLDALGRSLADQQAAIDSLRVELQTVNGKIEDQARERAGMRDEFALARDDLGLKITALEDRLAKMEAVQRAPTPGPPSPAAESPESSYERGVSLIQQKEEYAKGRDLLQEYLNRNPKSPLAVNAMYWIGESYYGEKKYENAILQFQDVIQKYGDHPKVASALLKQGYAFAVLGDKKNAKVILQRLIDTFPLSDEAKKAKERMAEWNKGKS
jgi:tol-pal system protein YbgF